MKQIDSDPNELSNTSEIVIADGFPELHSLETLEADTNSLGLAMAQEQQDELFLRRRLVFAGAPIAKASVDLLSRKLAYGDGKEFPNSIRGFSWKIDQPKDQMRYELGLEHLNEDLQALTVEAYARATDKKNFKLTLQFQNAARALRDLAIPYEDYGTSHLLRQLRLDFFNLYSIETPNHEWFGHEGRTGRVANITTIGANRFGVSLNSNGNLKDQLRSGLNLTVDLVDPSVGMSLHKNKWERVNKPVTSALLGLTGVGAEVGAYHLSTIYPHVPMDYWSLPGWVVVGVLGLIPMGISAYNATRVPGEVFSSIYQYDPAQRDFRADLAASNTKLLKYSKNDQPIKIDEFEALTSELVNLVPRK